MNAQVQKVVAAYLHSGFYAMPRPYTKKLAVQTLKGELTAMQQVFGVDVLHLTAPQLQEFLQLLVTQSQVDDEPDAAEVCVEVYAILRAFLRYIAASRVSVVNEAAMVALLNRFEAENNLT